jgi:hypothetical protein
MAPQIAASVDRKVSDAHWVSPHLLNLLRIRASQVCGGLVALSRARMHYPCEGTVLVVRNDEYEPFVVWNFHYDQSRPGTGINFFSGFYTENAREALDEYRLRPQ